jgi:hypothetical protein
MGILVRVVGRAMPLLGKHSLVGLLSVALLFAAWPQNLPAYQDPPAPAQAASAPPYTQQTPELLQQLVAPIALYPDSLVAQILGASTFPEQAVEADGWVQAHPDLKGDALGHAVDQQPWDPSVKALTAFPSVLGNMDKNLPWTSSLGDAYYNQQPDVMDAIQVMRQRAEQAGNLKSTPQQTIATQGSTIVIQPAAPRSSTSPRTILGWFTEIPSWRGRGGTRIPASGMRDLTFRSELASESVGSEVLDGAGVIGDSIGTTDTQPTITTATTPTATPFITGTISTGVETRAARVSTVPARRPNPSTETPGLLEDSLNPEARAASAREPSAAPSMAETQGYFRHVEAPVSAAAAGTAAASAARIGRKEVICDKLTSAFLE